MVYDRECKVIVMLSDLVEGGQVRIITALVVGSRYSLVPVSSSRRYATSTGPAVAHRNLVSSKWRSWGRRGWGALC